MNIIELIQQNQQIQKWQQNLNKSTRQLILGLSGTSKALVMASAFDSLSEKIIIFTATQNDAERLAANLSDLLGSDYVFNFFTDDSPIAEFVFASKDKTQTRTESLNFLLNKKQPGILVASFSASKIYLPNPADYEDSILSIKTGEEIEVDRVVKSLIQTGYKKVSRVLSQGEFSLRGDILDIYEMNSEVPYRIEFFGDEIDGIRTFDIEKQTSLQKVDSVIIYPASEVVLTDKDFLRAEKNIQEFIDSSSDLKQKSYLEEIISDIKTKYRHPDIRKFLSIFYEKEWTILDYLPKNSPIFFDDFHRTMDIHAQFEKEAAKLLTDDLQNCKSYSTLQYFADSYQNTRKYQPATYFSSFQKGLGNLKFDSIYSFNQHSMQEFFNQIPLLKEELQHYRKL